MTLASPVVPLVAAFAAGAMNAVAGGGSFLSFPALVAAGVPPIPANATNNAAMWVGSIGAVRGYAPDLRGQRRTLVPALIVSAIGAVLGALLLLLTPGRTFERMIPWLLLFATVVFALSPRLARIAPAGRHPAVALAAQFCVAIYGGYFGAGMGILMLAILGLAGLPSFNVQNAVKNALGTCINGVALIPFVAARIVDWRFALPMALLALGGAYAGARIFRRVPQPVARGVVVALGLAMTVAFIRWR